VVTKPFYFEGKKRLHQAEKGIKALQEVVDSIITIPNDRLLSLASKKATFLEMLKKADEVLYYAVKGISDLIMVPGLINLDFADVKAVMSGMGLALMGTGIAQGEGRAREAAMKAITSPLLEDVSIDGAQGVLMNITSGPDLTIDEVSEAASTISESARDDAQIYFGTVFDESAGDELRITVIATGIDQSQDDRQGSTLKREEKVTPIQPKGTAGSFKTKKQREAAPVQKEEDRNIPAYLRKGSSGQQEQEKKQGKAEPGEEEFVFDEDDFEIPSFIRRQAD
jgi:cell division protein FtsZ